MPIIPDKLKKGDEIRVIAPSRSLKIISKSNQKLAEDILKDMGFRVSYGMHVHEMDLMSSSSVESRLSDLHNAFRDKNVKAILAVIGGSNANQLLNEIDYDLIKNNPKIFCGFSDITSLGNAIYSQIGLVTYSGPHFSTFAMQKGNDYTIEYFKNILLGEDPVKVAPSLLWSDDAWFSDQKNRQFHAQEGYWVIREGVAEGTIIGGNLSTFQLLHGTSFMPDLKDKILFIEADAITQGFDDAEFDRDLQSLLHQPYANSLKAIVIGRFEGKFSMTREKLTYIISTKKELGNIPIIANIDFGHTMPIFTFPIGGKCRINAISAGVDIELKG